MSVTLHNKWPILAILGPTACGKTAVALALAARWPIEIISVDSALVYRDMDIGTAKPNLEELAVCPHHLINIIEPNMHYSAAQFAHDACRLTEEIRARGQMPVLVGGTMLYFKALREGLSQLPKADPALRARIEQDAARLGWPALHAQLAQHDPARAAALAPNDSQRIQRALEIVLTTQAPVANSCQQRETPALVPPVAYLALNPQNRSLLHERIAMRFEQMLSNGFVDEVRALRARGDLDLSQPAMRAVGYRQIWEGLDAHPNTDDLFLKEVFEKGVAATRQLAKRQITWLRQFETAWPDMTRIDPFTIQAQAQVLDWAAAQIQASSA